ncbi:MAG: DUF4157 domain-containing protein [Saprospiraceae bacterium]|nr:DUF4157 domain-containing protein [Saprospiraceae bacterium]
MAIAPTPSSRCRFYICMIFTLLSLNSILGQIRPWMPDTWPAELVLTAKGTGRTTGNIANITVINPTNEDLILEFPTLYIPSSGQYQPYVIPFPNQVSVSAGQTVNVPIEGYCVDIHKAPVPAGELMPPISTWIGKDPDLFTNTGIDPGKLMEYWGVDKPDKPGNPPGHSVIEFFPVDTSEHNPVVSNHIPPEMVSEDSLPSNLIIQQTVWWHTFSTGSDTEIPSNTDNSDDNPLLTEDLSNSANFDITTTETINDKDSTEQTNIQQTYWGYSIHIPKDSAMINAPLLFDAIDKIIRTTDSLKTNGLINTPFSGNSEREREAVIQQTFWSYSAALHDEPYTKEDFSEKLVEQFEEASGQSVSTAPAQVQEQLNQGVDDFWNTFQLVGAEAKVLQQPPTDSDLPVLPGKKDMEDAFGKSIGDIKAHKEPAGKTASETVGAEAFEPGNSVSKSGSPPSKDLAGHETAHTKQDHKEAIDGNKRITVDSTAKKTALEMGVTDPKNVVEQKVPEPSDTKHELKVASDTSVRPTPVAGNEVQNTDTDPPQPPPAEPAAPENTNCICDSLKFKIKLDRVVAPVGGEKTTEKDHESTVPYRFPQTEEIPNSEISITLSEDLKANEHFEVTFSDINFYCHCVNSAAGNVPCQFYKRASGKGQKAALGARVDKETKDKINVEKVEELKSDVEGQYKFKIIPVKDRKQDAGFCELLFEVYGACYSKDCVIEGQSSTDCKG